jgi:hypothetical protein
VPPGRTTLMTSMLTGGFRSTGHLYPYRTLTMVNFDDGATGDATWTSMRIMVASVSCCGYHAGRLRSVKVTGKHSAGRRRSSAGGTHQTRPHRYPLWTYLSLIACVGLMWTLLAAGSSDQGRTTAAPASLARQPPNPVRPAQASNTNQQMSLRSRWSSSTRSRIAAGSCSRCQAHSSRRAASAPPSGAAARAALIA